MENTAQNKTVPGQQQHFQLSFEPKESLQKAITCKCEDFDLLILTSRSLAKKKFAGSSLCIVSCHLPIPVQRRKKKNSHEQNEP